MPGAFLEQNGVLDDLPNAAMSATPVNQHPGNNLDLLRLIFASLVLLSHAPDLADGNRSRELLSLFTINAMSFVFS